MIVHAPEDIKKDCTQVHAPCTAASASLRTRRAAPYHEDGDDRSSAGVQPPPTARISDTLESRRCA